MAAPLPVPADPAIHNQVINKNSGMDDGRRLPKSMALLIFLGGLALGGAIAYPLLNPQQDCVQVKTTGGLEVTYSRGCFHPQRYKKWLITAMR